MIITQEHVGKKIRAANWNNDLYLVILYVGKERFFAIDKNGIEQSFSILRFNIYNNWELYEEPKKVKRMAPAIIKIKTHYSEPWECIIKNTDELFESLSHAGKRVECSYYGAEVIKWPASENLFVELEVDDE